MLTNLFLQSLILCFLILCKSYSVKLWLGQLIRWLSYETLFFLFCGWHLWRTVTYCDILWCTVTYWEQEKQYDEAQMKGIWHFPNLVKNNNSLNCNLLWRQPSYIRPKSYWPKTYWPKSERCFVLFFSPDMKSHVFKFFPHSQGRRARGSV